MLKEIPQWEGYFVSDEGYVVGKRGGILKPKLTSDGYHEVILSNGPKRKFIRVHRAVMWAFCGVCPDGSVVDHINNNRIDNRLVNLQYVTYAENVQKASICGNMPCKGRSYSSLSKTEILQIFGLACLGMSYRDICQAFSFQCRPDYLGEILSGRKLSSISGFKRDMRPFVQRLSVRSTLQA